MKVNEIAISGYVIEKYNHMLNAYTCNRLVTEAEKLGMDLKIIGIHDTYVREDRVVNNGCSLEKRDFVINRYKWGKLKDAINFLGSRTYNSLEAYSVYINKYEQVRKLHSDAFLIPKYVLATAGHKYENLYQYLGSPFVAKGLESSQGAEIFLIKKEQDFTKLRELFGLEKEWLLEEFISSSIGRDMRFYSIRGEVAACMVRKSQGDFRANVALGASVEKLEVTPAISQIAADLYAQTGLDFLGIDLLFGEEKPYFCEINVMPGIEGIEKATGVNVAGRIMQTIKEDIENSRKVNGGF